MPQITVKPYVRITKGRKYKVHSHKRRTRGLGKQISYKPVGKFLVAHDELGNFRGSKVILFKTKPRKTTKHINKRLRKSMASSLINEKKPSIEELDDMVFSGKLNLDDWMKQRKRLINS